MWNQFPVRLGALDGFAAALLAVACSASGPNAAPAGDTSNGGGGSGAVAGAAGGAGEGALGDSAGTSASGGSAGVAGSSGAAGIMGGSAGGGAGGGPALGPCDGPGIFLCDDFEASPVGSFPELEGWLDNDCTSHVIDGTTGHASSQSLKGQYQYNDCMVHADVTAHEDIYLRSWIKLGAPSSMSGHHIGMLELGSKIADDPELRIGIRDGGDACAGKPGVDVTVGGLPIGEKTSCSAVPLIEDQWYCLEAHVERDLPNLLRFSLWLDGAEIVAETSYEPVNADWDTGVLYFKVGRSSYGGNNEFPVWHDDVALGTERVGCAPHFGG